MKAQNRWRLTPLIGVVVALALGLATQSSFAAVAFRAATLAKAASGTVTAITTTLGTYVERANCGNLTPSIPAGSVGDLLVTQVVARRNAATITMPGWNTMFSDNVAGENYQAILFWRSATNTAADTNTVTQAGTCNQFMARITRFGNVDTAQPLETQPLPAGNWVYSNANNVDTGTQDITVANSMLVMATFTNDNGKVTQDASFTQLYDIADGSGADAGFSLNTRIDLTNGTKGPFLNMALSSGADPNHGVLFAVRPGPGVSNTTLTINRPAGGTTTGDVLMATLAVTTSTVTITPPSGWTEILNSAQTQGGTERLVTYWKAIADIGSESASYTWTFSATHAGAVGGIAAFSGADTANPVIASGARLENGNAATAHTAPSVTASAGDMLVTAHSYTSSGIWTPPGSMAEAVDIFSAAAAGAGGVSLEMNYELLAAAGATGTRVATALGNGDEGVSHALALQPIQPVSCFTVASGDWDNPAVWDDSCHGSNGIPVDGDTVTINNGHTVTLNVSSPRVAGMTVNNGGALGNTAGNTLNLGASVSNPLAGNGVLTNNGTLSLGTSGSVTLSTDFQFTGSASGTWTLNQLDLATRNLTFGAADSYTLGFASATPILNVGSLNTTGINSTITFQFGGAAQALPVANVIYPNVVLAGSGAKTLSGAGTFDVRGNFTLNSGPTFAAGASNVDLYGDFSNNGGANFNPVAADSGIWTFRGTALQNVDSTGILTTFPSLALNNNLGIALNASTTVKTLLTLTNGYISTGINILTLSANCNAPSWSRTNGFVAGNVQLTFPAGATTCRFPVGSGSVYAPIDLTTLAGSAGGTMTGSTTGNEHPNVASSSIDSSKDVNRFWTLSGDTINAGSYVATFNFVTGDVDVGASPLGFVLGRYDGAWTEPAAPTPSALAITASLAGPIVGVTDFVAGEAGFVCSVPSGSPVGTTCVCDNFNRVSLNPSTIYGGSWGVSTNSGSFGAPRIINNRLRLTDNTPSVSTAATSPGTFPARGNWISVEFKHYAYGSNTARTGTISTTSGATAVTGSGTQFTTALANGQHLYTAAGVYIGTVSSITSNTALTLTAGAVATYSNIAYGSTGAGADGIALTLSDSAVTAVPGAFGGSLGYAQKCQNGVAGCVNDCNVAGGCPGFTAGWVGIGLDEYGNFSNNTEGRVGVATPPPTAPGLTLDSVGVRGSGSGQIGYPYLGGTATLAPGIDSATSAAAAPGDAYRLMVDARGYTYHPTLNPGGVRSALVTVERDTSGTGTSYTPLFASFDAYVANPSQADVPENWQLSFTGSTGGANNIHEMLGLKICAQTYVPPAGYRIQVDNITPTTCPSDPQPTVTISPLNTNGQVITTYTNTVTLLATLSGGGASSATWVSQGTNQGTWDSVNKRYTFAAGDNGVAKFYLSDLVPQDVYITVTEYTAPGTLTSSLGTPVQFSSGAASFVVSTPAPDTLGDGVVAGRPHLMRITRNKATCGGGTDTTGYEGARALDGWYNPAAGDHPSGALAPQICAPVAGACLPAYGSCQTLSIAPPVVDSGNHNLSLTFLNGVADFCLITSDVGKYSLGLRDDTVATGTPAVTGTSTTLTARPFAVVASNITGGAITLNNPANGGAGGAIFTQAGAAFQASVGAYQWSGTADVDWNGIPDSGATLSQVTGTGSTPSYWWQTALAAALNSPSGGTLGTFGGSLVLGITSNTNPAPVTIPPPCTTPYFFSGIACLSDLTYGEVGSMNLNILPTQNFLNTSGLNLTAANGTVLVFDHSGAQNAVVGRFIPHHFSLAGSVVTRSDLQTTEGQATPFTYMDEPMKLTLTVIAEKLGGGTTENYSDAFAGYSKLDATTLGTGANWFNTGCAGSTQCMGLGAVDGATGLTDRLTIVGAGIYPLVVDPTISWVLGVGTVSAHLKLARSALPDGPFETLQLGAMPRDADGVTVLTPDLDAATGNSAPFGNPNSSPERRFIANTKVRFGRLWLGNACGSDKRDLTIPFRAEYRNGNNVFISNSDDSLTSIAQANIGLGNHQPVGFNGSVDLTHIPAGPFSVASGLGSFSLIKPTGLPAAGSVDIVFALGLNTATNASFDFSTAQPPTVGANMPYLRGKWYGANYDRDPVARAAFGIFCGGSGSRGPIYIRESY
ncbi:MAG: hypothetical protein Q8P42_01480 [Gallionella sp.]|nr:hypothetical protein [Gallionella sp.]